MDHLETLGFVERTKNPNDRRSYSLKITEKGNDVLDSRVCLTGMVYSSSSTYTFGYFNRHGTNDKSNSRC
ncbi:hypothetical protein Q3B96_05055 [Bacillus licheniformis]|nr:MULTISPECIES: hypothetical protein [Bacillus]MCX2880914.1 hypothetical protein [Bacillus sp. AR11]MDP4080920.1 hypothetical protein [Bacillota bacterium]MCC2133632.1 hypothetical protein [Bacillus licheniformis]MCC2145968.1 hypothetical protein [Bacillus licheniformis]MCC2161740.1 hypothetical protein [Bacillus licheniformis]